MNRLMSFSKKFINKHYSVSAEAVTPAMVNEAQRVIGIMKNHVENDDVDTWEFNDWLSNLFTIIPRKMDKVEKYVAKSTSEYMDILEREQEMLNVMQASVSQNTKVEKGGKKKTVLEALNLEVRECNDDEMSQILRHVEDGLRGRVVRAFRVSNKTTEKKFDKFCNDNGYAEDDVKFLYHGSRNQNWYGILSEGLKLNPDAPITGKMFGYGNYFAPRLRKSMGYCSVRDSYWNNEKSDVGYVAVYKVAMKNPKHVDKYTSEVGSATQKTMDRWGTDGVYAHKKAGFLYNDECIVYREEQSTIRYLLELK